MKRNRQEVADQLSRRIASQYPPDELHSMLCVLSEEVPRLALGNRTNLEALRRVAEHYLPRLSIALRPGLHRFASTAVPLTLGLAFGGRFENRVRILGHWEELEGWFQRGTVVLVATHSSNLDGPVLGAAIARRRLPACVYPAGKHLYRNAWAGRMVSGLGGYQLDRSLASALYKKLVVEYSAMLIEEGHHSVIFASGTRSRSGEVETHLKLGLLGSILRAQRYRLAGSHRPRPIFVVPVSINHRVVPEARVLIQYQLEGRQKERVVGDEMGNQGSAWSMARRVWDFEEQVSLSFGAAMNPLGGPSDEDAVPGPDKSELDAEHTRRLGKEIARAFQRGTRFESTHVVARALYDLEVREGDDVDRARVLECINATRSQLMRDPALGSLMDTCATATASVLLEEANRAWASCYEGGVIHCRDALVRVVDSALLLYYRNRSAHIC
jgi:glycerol-3-phosphate O-acyltransferase